MVNGDVTAEAQAVNGERDRNFRLGGAARKFHNPADEASTRTLRHLAAEGLPTRRLIPTLRGKEVVAEIGGQAVAVLLTCLPVRCRQR
ncbi:hypothetical protein CG51_06900 [Haematobacter missouriensis]|uniref:Uncharacterized protein n=1 Tax=Haematobacter missouriensis TaxID=366616 RepID=A0A212ASH1_9RHOB|nr:hypothetical protein [Haematobacter missouriensis]KFI29883.1 hypothetical protein CG51_06900 [Haematobacter missouriensis]OWJ74774.1 hypothetical protein CDV53_12505 [Haematobacter missouriensis]OWJ84385.1 hypothetical protein CDV52_08480 [Haematobacter missouriensis]